MQVAGIARHHLGSQHVVDEQVCVPWVRGVGRLGRNFGLGCGNSHAKHGQERSASSVRPNALLTARPRDGAARTEGTFFQWNARPYRKPWHSGRERSSRLLGGTGYMASFYEPYHSSANRRPYKIGGEVRKMVPEVKSECVFRSEDVASLATRLVGKPKQDKGWKRDDCQ